ncbi:MAG: hypothetical protein V4467_04880 [Patescibacteria group bacterium]
MPIVFVTIDRECPSLSTETQVINLGRHLQHIVAEALTCDESPLTASDVEVEIKDRDAWRSIGGGKYELRIIVIATRTKSRETDLSMAAYRIAQSIRCYVPSSGNGYVWVQLPSASFAPFR